jgi:hypothetical protein
MIASAFRTSASRYVASTIWANEGYTVKGKQSGLANSWRINDHLTFLLHYLSWHRSIEDRWYYR